MAARTVTAIADVSDRSAELQSAIREQLIEWREKAMALWELTARIGATLAQAYKQVDPEAWTDWLDELGLSPYGAFVLMRAQRYPELMRQHKPGSLEAMSRLLPQGQGTAYDREQAGLARQFHEGGMSKSELRVRFGVSDQTLTRWLDPERHKRDRQRRAARERDARERRDQQKTARRQAAVKSHGGQAAVAYEHIRKAAEALNNAATDAAGERRQSLNHSLTATYQAEDALMKALGIE
jgi:transposase